MINACQWNEYRDDNYSVALANIGHNARLECGRRCDTIDLYSRRTWLRTSFGIAMVVAGVCCVPNSFRFIRYIFWFLALRPNVTNEISIDPSPDMNRCYCYDRGSLPQKIAEASACAMLFIPSQTITTVSGQSEQKGHFQAIVKGDEWSGNEFIFNILVVAIASQKGVDKRCEQIAIAVMFIMWTLFDKEIS